MCMCPVMDSAVLAKVLPLGDWLEQNTRDTEGPPEVPQIFLLFRARFWWKKRYLDDTCSTNRSPATYKCMIKNAEA